MTINLIVSIAINILWFVSLLGLNRAWHKDVTKLIEDHVKYMIDLNDRWFKRQNELIDVLQSKEANDDRRRPHTH